MLFLLVITLTGVLRASTQDGPGSPLPPPYPTFDTDVFPPPFTPRQQNFQYLPRDGTRDNYRSTNDFMVQQQPNTAPQSRGIPMDLPEQTQPRTAKQFLHESLKPQIAPDFSFLPTNQQKTPRKFESMTPDGFKSTIEEIGEKWLPPLEGDSGKAKFPLQDWDQEIMKKIMELGNPFASEWSNPIPKVVDSEGKVSKTSPESTQQQRGPEMQPNFSEIEFPSLDEPKLKPMAQKGVVYSDPQAAKQNFQFEEFLAPSAGPATSYDTEEVPKFKTAQRAPQGAKPTFKLEEFIAPNSDSATSYIAEDVPKYTQMIEKVLKQVPVAKSITEVPSSTQDLEEPQDGYVQEIFNAPEEQGHAVYEPPRRPPGTFHRRNSPRKTYRVEDEPHHELIRGEAQFRRYFANQRRQSARGRSQVSHSYREDPSRERYQEYIPPRSTAGRHHDQSRGQPRRQEIRRTEPEEPIMDYPAPEIPKDAARYMSKWSHVSEQQQQKKGIQIPKNKHDYQRFEPNAVQDLRPRYEEVLQEPENVEPEGQRPRVTYQKLPDSPQEQPEEYEECEDCPCCQDGTCDCCSDCEGGEVPEGEEEQEPETEATTPEAEEVAEDEPRQRPYFRREGRREENLERTQMTEKPKSEYYTIMSKETTA